tara:strand:- start:600 stop:1370 length:771 start_codon:yes stop_codon:yes gene_type:complete
MKKLLKNIFEKFGFEIRRKPNEEEIKYLTFDEIYKKKILNMTPIIFDIGANKGQSIDRFLKINEHSFVHSFEPNIDEFKNLEKKYQNFKNVKLNNIALGEKITKKTLNIASHSGNSSFFEVKKKSNWLKLRSQQLGIDEENYISKKIEVGLETVDSYCKNNSVNRIDIMKIDTQLYEEQVLKGSENMIKNEKIDAIEIEIVFSSAYEKYVCFSDIEKYLLPHNYRFSGINLHNNNLFSGTIFFADVLFLNKTKFKL